MESEMKHETSGPLVALVTGLCLGLAPGCTDSGLQPLEDPQTDAVDDLLTVKGTVCTSDPTEAVFPTKIMIIVDCSGSMQFTDPSTATTTTDSSGATINAYSSCVSACTSAGVSGCSTLCSGANNPGRQGAITKLVNRFKNNPAVSFSIIRFNGRITVNGSSSSSSSSSTGSSFTNNTTTLKTAIDGLAQADITTDYQGALSTAYEELEKDMKETSPAELVRTKYIILFLSDGEPNPQCKDGCGNDSFTIEGVTIDSWCDVNRDEWCDNFGASGSTCTDMKNWYPSMDEPCKAYNTESQIVQKVYEIIDLGEQYSVAEIKFHTAFLFVPTLPAALLSLMGVSDPTVCEDLLKAMAKAGGGLFRSFASGQQIDFLSINYSTVSRPFGMTNFIVTNTNTLPAVSKIVADSDGDGIDDETEYNSGLNMKSSTKDSDGDGYGDLLEYRKQTSGFDPGDATAPVKKCSDTDDVDGDGLNGCEEKILGTDAKIVDSDRDRIPDGLEYIYGLDPMKVSDAKADPDFDGRASGEEIRIHSDPMVSDADLQGNYKYIYDVREQGERSDRKKCYDFNVRQVRLITTAKKQGIETAGYNDLMVYFGEGPSDDPTDYGEWKAACVRAQYVKPNYKNPASGSITLKDSDFMTLPKLAKAKKAALSDSTQDPCVGAPLP
jgi:hypothetical protein